MYTSDDGRSCGLTHMGRLGRSVLHILIAVPHLLFTALLAAGLLAALLKGACVCDDWLACGLCGIARFALLVAGLLILVTLTGGIVALGLIDIWRPGNDQTAPNAS